MSIKKRIWFIPGIAILIFVVGMIFVYQTSLSTFAVLKQQSTTDFPFLESIEMLSPKLKTIQDNFKNAVTFNDKDLLLTAKKNADEFADTLKSLKQIEGKSDVADRILKQFDTYYSAAYDSAAIMLGEKTGDAGDLINKMVPALKELEKDIESETVKAEKTFRENLHVSSDNVKHSLYWNIGISVSVITVLLILSVFIIRSITRNLNKILDHTTSSGIVDLTQKIYIDDNDEFAQIATWINQFVDKLNESMSNVSETTRQVDGASLEMVRTNNSITDGSNRQMIEAEQVASAIEEIGTTINEVAANATDVASSASSAYLMAQESGNIIQATISEMHKVADFVNNASSMVENLGRSSSRIGEITNVIVDISNQTNLLALNAAIEAARAGDLGRGFAVVADEVRKLAERTTEATKLISEMVQNTQSETGNIVSCIESGKNQVVHGVEKANEAQNALQKILQAIDAVTGKTQQIASVTEEQSSTANLISSNIHKIVEISRQNYELTSGAVVQSRELNSATGKLSSIVNKFKIN